MLNYIVYCRKSTEARDRQALSIEAQKRELLEFAKLHNLHVVKVMEESQSAYKLGRPVFDKMMKQLEEGLGNAILTWKSDRLARNAVDGGRVIQSLDDKVVQEIRTPMEVFRQEDNRMMLYMLFGMSNDFSRQISANVKRGNRQKYERGEYIGKAPLGYLNESVGLSRNIVPDPVKAPLVKKLFETYATGKYSVLQLCNYAYELGLTSIFNHKIGKSEMYRFLSRTAYYGVYQHNGQFHQGSYEPIISKDLFDRVQEVLTGRSTPRKQQWVHAYKGLIKCANCGCAITAETKQKHYKRTNRSAIYVYYHCTRRRGRCNEPGLTEKELEEMIYAKISQISIDKEVWSLGIKLLKAKNAVEFENLRTVKSYFEKDIIKLETSMERLLQMRLDEEITADEYAAQKKLIVDKKMVLKERIADREHTSANWLELCEKFFETAYYAREIMDSQNIDQKRELVRSVGYNLFLKDKNLQFSFKKPYDVLLKPEMRFSGQG